MALTEREKAELLGLRAMGILRLVRTWRALDRAHDKGADDLLQQLAGAIDRLEEDLPPEERL